MGTGREDHPFPATRLMTSHDDRRPDARSVSTLPNGPDSGGDRGDWLSLLLWRCRYRLRRWRYRLSIDGDPLHYTDAEIIQGWPGDDDGSAQEWLTARRKGRRL